MISLIEQRLVKLETCTEVLSMACGYLQEDFLLDPILQGGVKWHILRGLNYIIEVSQLIIGQYHFTCLNTPQDILRSLRDNRVCPPWLMDSIATKAKDILMDKDYLDQINGEDLYDMLEGMARNYRHFKKYVLEFVI